MKKDRTALCEALFQGIGMIDDDLIDDAQNILPKCRKSPWKKWAAAAACIGIVIVGGGSIITNLFHVGSSPSMSESVDDSVAFSPVFPLTLEKSDAEIQSERSTDYDFSPYMNLDSCKVNVRGTEKTWEGPAAAVVTDQFVLTNHSNHAKTVQALYPFAANLNSHADCMPEIFIDGLPQDTKLLMGGTMGSENTADIPIPTVQELSPKTWQGYETLLQCGIIKEHTAQKYFDFPVTVYEISVDTMPEGLQSAEFVLSFEYDPQKTQLLTDGINGTAFNEESQKTELEVTLPNYKHNDEVWKKAYLIVIGEDIHSLTTYGKVLEQKEWKDEPSVEGTVQRFESNCLKMLQNYVHREYQKMTQLYPNRRSILSEYASEEMMLDALAERMWYDHAILGYDFAPSMLEYGRQQDILYVSFPVTIPAESSVTVTSVMMKEASIRHTGKAEEDIHGYDMVMTLGSNLNFIRESASVSNTDGIRILSQNFGFDLAHSITQVTLKPETEHYYMTVSSVDSKEGKE